jgi:hypothetical protein
MMADIVEFPQIPEWATRVDTKTIDGLIAKGWLKPTQRNDWRAVQFAINNFLFAEVFNSNSDKVLDKLKELTGIEPVQLELF